tara:strand:+ start:3498 stop:4721 length:1224 start_codon:yes stop_codon:yes gene_type:complete
VKTKLLWKCLLVFLLLHSKLTFAASSDIEWQDWLVDQISIHPEVVSAREAMNASLSLADGLERPIYNPVLGGGIEREGDANNFNVGISQTFDWTNKQSVRETQAVYSREAARQYYQIALQQKLSEALLTLVEWQAARDRAELALTQEDQLNTLVDLFAERQDSGDLGQIDVELAILGLSQRLNVSAQALAELRDIEARLLELLPDWTEERGAIPDSFWSSELPTQPSLLLDEHPFVMSAKADWEALQQVAELANRATRSDPSIGINAGETDNENQISLSFSIPLNVRNNYNAEARAANQTALAAEAEYRAVRRQQEYVILAAMNILEEYRTRFLRWQNLIGGIEETSAELLEIQWNAGDISTTEYLLALQQRTEGLMAGIELQKLYKRAEVNLLYQTGQITNILSQR